MSQGPVFIFSLHRSGGTLLMRLLNCHPNLVIWGEHGGILNQFVEMNEIIKLHRSLNPLGNDEQRLAEFVNNEGEVPNMFAPWAGPLSLPAFRAATKNFISEIFSRGLKPGQRWGFKEIRYFKSQTATFLYELFPEAQFVLLQRELVEAAVSNIMAPWSLRMITKEVGDIDEAKAHKIIEDVGYGLLAFERAFEEIAAKFPRRTICIDYGSLRDSGLTTIIRVTEFLKLKVTPEVLQEWMKTLSAKLGETDKASVSGGLLNRAFIQQHLTNVLPQLRARFDTDGIAPLLSWPAQKERPYAAMLGDHALEDVSYSTLF